MRYPEFFKSLFLTAMSQVVESRYALLRGLVFISVLCMNVYDLIGTKKEYPVV